ncbi:MAG TPA: dynamin family protein [Chloroflexota bacterium]|nr:dynamin family protein [Chloroflexota bacterium]
MALADLARERDQALLADERAALGALREALVAADAAPDDLAVLRQAEADLDTLFLLVVVGEFNAGKSAFINALLGEPVLAEGVTPTTAAITLVRYGDVPAERRVDGVVERDYPDPLLRTLAIVDTPGTNAVLREHEALTDRFVPRADLVLFVTSADRPFSESERAFMERIRAWGKKLVLVLNKADLLAGPDEVAAQIAFVREQAQRLLGLEPEVFPVSARQALAAKASPPLPESWQRLERYLRETLDDRARLRLKLASPLGVADRLAERYHAAAETQLATLRGDLQLGEHLAAQLEVYRGDLERDFSYRLQEIDNLLHDLNARGTAFFDETLRLGRLFDLFNQGRIRGEFEAQVVADTPQRIDRAAQDLIDWMAEQDVRLWEAVREQLERRQATRAAGGPSDQLLGGVERDRRALLGSIAATAREVVLRHNHAREAEELAAQVRSAITQATLVEAGAVGFGALTLAIMGSVAADLTGILASIAIAGLGLFVLPLQKRRVTERFRQSTEDLRAQLTGAMREAFARELRQSLERIRNALAPYERFARVEYDRAAQLEGALAASRAALAALRARIDQL